MTEIMESLSPILKGGTLEQLSGLTGGSPSQARQVLATALPVSIAGLAEHASTFEGSRELLEHFENDDYPHLDPSQIGDLAHHPRSSERLMDQSRGFMSQIFGDRQARIVNTLAGTSGTGTIVSSKLLGLAMPMVLGYVGKRAMSSHLDARGLSRFLGEQKNEVAELLPAPIASMFGSQRAVSATTGKLRMPEVIDRSEAPALPPRREPTGLKSSSLPWALAALAALAIIGWLAMRPRSRPISRPATIEAVNQTNLPSPPLARPVPTAPDVDTAPDGRATAPANGNANANARVGANATEAAAPSSEMTRYLASAPSTPRRFVLDGIQFATGSTELNADGRAAAAQLATTLKQHPSVRARIVGVADATGNAAVDERTSLGRAQAVKQFLVTNGVNADCIDVEATGPQRANDTMGDRQQNRQLEVELTP